MNQIMTEADYRRQIRNMASAAGEAGFRSASGGHCVYLFFGEEDYLKHNAVAITQKLLVPGDASAFDFITIDASAYSPSALSSALAAPPMFGEHKVVVLSLSLSDMKQSEQNEMFELLEALGPDDWNVVLLNIPDGGFDGGTPKKPSSALTKLADWLVPVRFDRITGSRLITWTEKHYENRGVSASEGVCAVTVEHCGADMFRLSSEIDKISYYVLSNGRNTVSAEDVKTAGCPTEDFDTFALANAMMSGQYAAALEVLSAMKARRDEPVRIMADIIRVICDMTSVCVCMRSGMQTPEIAAATGIKPYPLGKYINALRDGRIGIETLERSLALAREADAGVKGFGQDYVPIEKLICSL